LAKISEHTFKAYFSYDNTLATCYDTDSTVTMVDDNAPFIAKAEDEKRNNLTPTNVYGQVKFVLRNSGDNSVNNSVKITIYCNQKGETNVIREY
ncbi:MAG: hypothetical protein MJB12_17560, partial [Firmicutes bacterium]|nr:hypothetical protein [Bacillota bacterium]